MRPKLGHHTNVNTCKCFNVIVYIWTSTKLPQFSTISKDLLVRIIKKGEQ